MNNKYNVKINNFLFDLAYFLLLFKIALANTTFVEFIDTRSTLFKLIYPISFILIGIKFLYRKKLSIKNIVVGVSVLFISVFCYLYSDSSEIIVLLILILGIKDVDSKNVAKCFFFTYVLVLVLALFFSLFGIIDLYYVVDKSKGVRYSLGNTYPTDFAAGIFYLLLAFVYLKSYWKYRYTVIWIIIISFMYVFTKALTSTLLSALLLIIMTFTNLKNSSFRYNIDKKLNRFIRIISCVAFPLCAAISAGCVALFTSGNSMMQNLNITLNYRIGFAARAFNDYGLTLFGSLINMSGAGYNTDALSSYYYIDNGYYLMFLSYGILIAVVILFGFYLLARKSNNSIINLILIFIAINGLIEPRFINYLYNPFLLFIGYALFTRKGKRLDL